MHRLNMIGIGLIVGLLAVVLGSGYLMLRSPSAHAAQAQMVCHDPEGRCHLPPALADAGVAHSSWLGSLFEVYVPRQQCMYYQKDVIWLNAVSDGLIGAAYFSIPLALMYFVRRRRDLAFHWMFYLFALFIVTCGTTHFLSLLAIWHPLYRLDGLVKALTALASLLTAFLLWPLIPHALTLPSPAQLRATNSDLEAQIVQRKQAEEEQRSLAEQLSARLQDLQRSEERFRLLLDGAQDYAIFMLDLEGRVSSWNTGAQRLFGWTEQQILHQPVARFFRAEDVSAGLLETELTNARQQGRWETQAWRVRQDGSMFWANSILRAIRESDGKLVGFAKVVRDLTEQTRTEDLERAKEAADQANRMKDHFLAVLSHELRTPLAPVIPTLAMLHEDPRLAPELREPVELIRRNVELEARLIDDLLDVTRIARGKVELGRRPVRLEGILTAAVEVCQPDIEARQLHFGVDAPDGPYVVDADPARLQQVFWNLLRNAIKFTPQGGCVGIRCHRESAKEVLVEVKDSGVGIAPEALVRIFDPFEQAERSITRRFGGLGLGLAITKAMVEMHGGTIQAHSDGHNRGATFAVRLPLLATDALARTDSQQQTPAVAASRAARPLRILLVEDHGDTAKTMMRVLKLSGHSVIHAGDVATAMKLARETSFDLLLSDLGLPDASGLDLLQGLRAAGFNLPAIALSGYGQEQDLRQSREAGFARHLVKPVDLMALEAAIHDLTSLAGNRSA